MRIIATAIIGLALLGQASAQLPPVPPKLNFPKQITVPLQPQLQKKFSYNLTWVYSSPMPVPGITFYIYTSATGRVWSLMTTTNRPPIPLTNTQASQFFTVVATNLPGKLTLAWVSSTGTNVVNYNLRQGPSPGVYTYTNPVGNVTTCTTKTIAGTNAFCLTAVDKLGLESVCDNLIWGPSNPVKASIVRQ